MGKYFGTDGFRGEANVVLTYDHAIKIGRFLGWYYGARIGKKAKIVIGKDTRRSSYMFEYALCTGLMASGADAYIMHVTTTPSVSYITRTDDFDCFVWPFNNDPLFAFVQYIVPLQVSARRISLDQGTDCEKSADPDFHREMESYIY